MQYFRNMPRRAMDCQSPRSSDMFPLCRNDRDERTNGARERQTDCGCTGRNTEIGSQGRVGTFGPMSDHSSENERSCRLGCFDRNEAREADTADHVGSCGCNGTSRSEDYGCTGLAMSFVPEQEFDELNDAEEALCRGTLFRKLDMPFYGQRRRSCK